MYKGKKKCKMLKEIRAEIAKNNGIEYVVEECKHKGDCAGTCPKCEAEVRMLEEELAKRASAGKRVLLTGVAAGIMLTGVSCTPDAQMTLSGDIAAPTQTEETVKQSEGFTAQTPGTETTDNNDQQETLQIPLMGDPLPTLTDDVPMKTVPEELIEKIREYLTERGSYVTGGPIFGSEVITETELEKLVKYVNEQGSEFYFSIDELSEYLENADL